ncbi:MAG: segregation/condensation protein A [Oligoflexia bacterium]|nr:segregation/condensation protein A [Oligoflexia bacterium]
MTAVSQRLPITVRLESFEGPLDLLLYLIQSHELDISKISISKITDQYLAYVRLMQELNFDTASEFLVMAATLLHWKSKSILPKEQDPNAADALDQEPEMSQEELVRQLLEHQRFLAAGEDLAQLPFLGEDVFTRPNRKPPVEKIWKTMNLTDLTVAYQDMLARERKRTTVLRKETVSIAGKIVEFRDRLKAGQLTGLHSLLVDQNSEAEAVVTFLASLELSRMRKMRLHQERTYAEIYLELLESLHDINESDAFEFDTPNSEISVNVLRQEITTPLVTAPTGA